jgi:hypothetical protein
MWKLPTHFGEEPLLYMDNMANLALEPLLDLNTTARLLDVSPATVAAFIENRTPHADA